jgi:oligopeptide transport system permease protein
MIILLLMRLLQVIPVLFVVTTATFFLLRAAPGGPFDNEKRVSADMLERLNDYYGLNEPLFSQYLQYMGNLLRGDLGPSFRYPAHSVNDLILTGLPISLELACYALLFALFVGIAVGSLASSAQGTWRDHAPMAAAMMGICVPALLLGPVLILVFGVYLQWLPPSGWGITWSDRILPTVTLGSAYAAYIARLTRGGMLEVINQEFVRTAYSKGMPAPYVLFRHVMKTGLLPVVSFLGPAIAGLISGSFIVETLFHIPGLGRFFVQAAFNRDYTTVLGTTLFYAALIFTFNMLADGIAAWMDPRARDNATRSQ